MKSHRLSGISVIAASTLFALTTAIPAGAVTKPSYTPLYGDKFQSVYFKSWNAKGATRLGFKAYFLSPGTPSGYVGPSTTGAPSLSIIDAPDIALEVAGSSNPAKASLQSLAKGFVAVPKAAKNLRVVNFRSNFTKVDNVRAYRTGWAYIILGRVNIQQNYIFRKNKHTYDVELNFSASSRQRGPAALKALLKNWKFK